MGLQHETHSVKGFDRVDMSKCQDALVSPLHLETTFDVKLTTPPREFVGGVTAIGSDDSPYLLIGECLAFLQAGRPEITRAEGRLMFNLISALPGLSV
jgi:hypothetical protein